MHILDRNVQRIVRFFCTYSRRGGGGPPPQIFCTISVIIFNFFFLGGGEGGDKKVQKCLVVGQTKVEKKIVVVRNLGKTNFAHLFAVFGSNKSHNWLLVGLTPVNKSHLAEP